MPPEHLERKESARGFVRLPHIPGSRNDRARVYESSDACTPAIWLTCDSPDYSGVTTIENGMAHTAVHLPLEQAFQVAEQLLKLVATHYNGHPQMASRAEKMLRSGADLEV